MKILTIKNKKEEKFLRQKTAGFDLLLLRDAKRRGEISELVKNMRETMAEAEGVGLSANQVGLNMRLFTARVPSGPVKRDENNKIIMPSASLMKFYAIFNPEIIKFSKEKIEIEEGCLSVPGYYGLVERPEKITITGYDKNGKKLKIKAWGMLARVFQHEMDHLNGFLFINRTKKIFKITDKNEN